METSKTVIGTIKNGRKIINIFAGDKVKTFANGKSILINAENPDGLAISKPAVKRFELNIKIDRFYDRNKDVQYMVAISEIKKETASFGKKVGAVCKYFENFAKEKGFVISFSNLASFYLASFEKETSLKKMILDLFFLTDDNAVSNLDKNDYTIYDIFSDFDMFVCYETLQSELSKETEQTSEVSETVAVAEVEKPKTYNEISAVLEKYIVDLAKGKKGLEFVTESYIANIGVEVVKVLGKGGGHLIEIIGNYQAYLPKQLNDYIDFHTCLNACRNVLSGVTPPPNPPMLNDFAEEIIREIFSNGNSNVSDQEYSEQYQNGKNFESSDDFLADGVKAIMQQLTKVVRKETIALRLLHFFNAHARKYNCIPIESLQGEKEFIDAYCQTKSIAFLSGLNHFVSTQMIKAMQDFAEQEFDKEIYFSENRTEFARGELVIDKYGYSFEIDKIKDGYYYMPLPYIAKLDDHNQPCMPCKAEELRLVCQYESDCIYIEESIETVNIYSADFVCQCLKTDLLSMDYQNFWVYKLQNLAGEEKDYIIREIVKLDKDFAKYLCQRTCPKIKCYKALYDFLELAI